MIKYDVYGLGVDVFFLLQVSDPVSTGYTIYDIIQCFVTEINISQKCSLDTQWHLNKLKVHLMCRKPINELHE